MDSEPGGTETFGLIKSIKAYNPLHTLRRATVVAVTLSNMVLCTFPPDVAAATSESVRTVDFVRFEPPPEREYSALLMASLVDALEAGPLVRDLLSDRRMLLTGGADRHPAEAETNDWMTMDQLRKTPSGSSLPVDPGVQMFAAREVEEMERVLEVARSSAGGMEPSGVNELTEAEESFAAARELQQQLGRLLIEARRAPLPRRLTVVPEDARWQPTEGEIHELVAAAEQRALEIDESTVLRASRYIRSDDAPDIKALVVTVVGAVAIALATGAVIALAKQAFLCIFSNDECSCGDFVWAAVCGAISAAIFAAVALSGGAFSSAYVLLVVLGHSAPIGLEDIGCYLAGQLLGEGLAEKLCGLIGLSSAAKDRAGEEVKTIVMDQYGDGLVTLWGDASSQEPSPSSSVRLLIADQSGSSSGDYHASDTVSLDVDFMPFVEATFRLRTWVTNASEDFPLHDVEVSSLADEVGTVKTVSLEVPAATLLGLDPSGDEQFSFNARLDCGAWTSEITPAERPGVRISDPINLNRQPSVQWRQEIASNLLSFTGVYSDPDGDSAALLQLVVDGTPTNLSTTGLPQEGASFSLQKMLPNGVHTAYLRYSDGIAPVSETEPWEIRASSSPPVVSLSLASSTANVGVPVPFTAHIADGAGPISEREIRLSSDLRGVIYDATGQPSFRLVTDPSGDINGSYIPTIPGEHMVLAQDVISKSFDYDSVDVSGGEVGDWTMQWTWQVVSNSEDAASYYCTILILYKGQKLDPGDYVNFSSNHGSFVWPRDQVLNDGTVNNTFNLTRSEADSGNEILTLTLPAYGVELQYVTNLTVGSPAELTPSRVTSLQGTNSFKDAFSVAFSDDGTYVARIDGTGENVNIYNVGDLSLVRTVRPGGRTINALSFSPDSTRLAAGDEDGYLTVINIATGTMARSSITNGHNDIINLDWYDADRIACATEGLASYSYGPKVLIANSASNLVRTISLPDVSMDDDARRITCSAGSQLCAAATGIYNTRWYLFTPGGSFLGGEAHPDNGMIWALAFNQQGDRLLVGGDDNGGIVYVNIYSVSSGGASILAQPITTNDHTFAAEFLSDNGSQRLALGGTNSLEIFPADGGASLATAPDPGNTQRYSYHLDYLSGTKQLVAITNYSQTFYNFSGDYSGPSLYFPEPAPLKYNETSITLGGNVEDPAGVSKVECQVNGGGWIPTPPDVTGYFSLTLSDVAVGDTVVTVRAYDGYNNASTVSITVTRQDDLKAPTISNCSVTPSSGGPGVVFTIACDLIDLESGIASAQWAARSQSGVTVAGPASMAPVGGSTYQAGIDTTGFADGTYVVEVTAVDASSHANAATLSDAAGFNVSSVPLPAAPSSLNAVALSDNQIDLSWSDNATNESGFKIERKTEPDGTWGQIATVAPNSVSSSDAGLQPSTEYRYRVCAYNASGDSDYSNEAAATTLEEQQLPDIGTVLLTGGTLAGQAISANNWVVYVEPGQELSGNIQYETNNLMPSSAVAPMGYTWTWGDRQTSIVEVSGSISTGSTTWDTPISLSAPALPGTYYLLVGFSGEFNMAQVFSCDNWSAGGGVVWNDGNDYFDLPPSSLYSAHLNGFVPQWPYRTGTDTYTSKDIPVMPVKVVVSGGCAVGNSWEDINLPVVPAGMYDIAADQNQWVAVGIEPDLLTGITLHSVNGRDWQEVTFEPLTNLAGAKEGVATNGSVFVAVGAGIMTSADGVNWVDRTPADARHMWSVVWNGSRFVAVGGSDSSSSSIWASESGEDWTLVHAAPATKRLTALTWDGSEFVAVGEPVDSFWPYTYTSSDGLTWTEHVSYTLPELYGWVYAASDGDVVVIAEEWGDTLAVSDDGVEWTVSELPIPFLYDTRGRIKWTGREFVVPARRSDTYDFVALVSQDGVAWEERSIGGVFNVVGSGPGGLAALGAASRFQACEENGGLSNGVPAADLSGTSGFQYFHLDVPEGATDLVFQISGGTGDADLYVRLGSEPTLGEYDCRPYIGGNSEVCTFPVPAAGRWYAGLYPYEPYSGVTLTASFTSPAGCDVTVSNLAVTTATTRTSCGTLRAGPSVTVGPTGNLTLKAAGTVILGNGVEVQSGGALIVAIDPSLALP